MIFVDSEPNFTATEDLMGITDMVPLNWVQLKLLTFTKHLPLI